MSPTSLALVEGLRIKITNAAMIKWPLNCIGRKYASRTEMVPPQAREGD